MTLEKKKTLILCIILVLCLAVLGILISLVAKNALTPADQSEAQYMELPRLQGLSLSEAKKVLTDLNISYEIVHTDDNTINRVLDIEYKGKTENGKDMLEIGTAVKLFANEVGIDKIVYLTFDDGPTYSNTYDILDTLDQYEAKATFFVLGNRVHEYADRIEATYERGHTLACHSYSHDLDRTSSGFVYKSIGTMLDEIRKYEDAMKDVLGVEIVNNIPKLFRFPGGSTTNGRISKDEALDYIANIREKGYKIYDWTALTGDAEGNSTASEFIAYLENGINKAKQNGDPIIILMHDKYSTNQALSEILDYLKSNGYYFDTLDNCPEYTFAEN